MAVIFSTPYWKRWQPAARWNGPKKRAEEEADKAIAALQVLPDSPWREALIGLAHIAVQRDH